MWMNDNSWHEIFKFSPSVLLSTLFLSFFPFFFFISLVWFWCGFQSKAIGLLQKLFSIHSPWWYKRSVMCVRFFPFFRFFFLVNEFQFYSDRVGFSWLNLFAHMHTYIHKPSLLSVIMHCNVWGVDFIWI